jgi:hypothetical protein
MYSASAIAVLADLQASIPHVHRLVIVMHDSSKLGDLGLSKALFYLPMQRPLIAFQAEVPVLVNDLLGNGDLPPPTALTAPEWP